MLSCACRSVSDRAETCKISGNSGSEQTCNFPVRMLVQSGQAMATVWTSCGLPATSLHDRHSISAILAVSNHVVIVLSRYQCCGIS